MTPPAGAFEAITYLSQLQQLDVPAAEGLDPLELFFESQRRAISGTIEALQRQFHENADTMEDGSINTWNDFLVPCAARNFPGTINHQSCTSHMSPAAVCIREMTHSVVRWANDFWRTTVVDPTKELDIWKGRMEEAERVVYDILGLFEKAILDVTHAHLGSFTKDNSSGINTSAGEETTELMEGLVKGCLELEKVSGNFPVNGLRRMRALIFQVAAAIASVEHDAACVRVRKFAKSYVKKTCYQDTTTLNLLVSSCMHVFSDLHTACARASVRVFDGSSACHPSKTMCALVLTFATGTMERVRLEIALKSGPESPPDRALLQAWAIVDAVKTNTVPQIAATWEPLLTTGCSAADVSAALRQCCEEVDSIGTSLVKLWMDRKLEQLDLIMEEFLASVVPAGDPPPWTVKRDGHALAASWPAAAQPRAAKPATWTLITALGALRSDLVNDAPALRQEVMTEIMYSILGGVAELLGSGLLKDVAEDAVYQLWIDLAVIKAAVGELGDEVGEAMGMAENLCLELEASLRGRLSEADKVAPSMADRRRRVNEVCSREVAASWRCMKSLHPLEE